MRGARPEDPHTNQAMPYAGQLKPTYSTGGGDGGRKKDVGVRPWLALRSSGMTEKAGKHTIMRLTGLLARDLRILDPLCSYPSTVLGREKAIVINLEHIKAIITAKEVLLLNSNDPSVSLFIDDLKKRIMCHHQATKPQDEEKSEGEGHTRTDPSQGEAGTCESKKHVKHMLENQDGSKALAFEFVALEACLESAASSLEHEALSLELEAHPSLERLTSKISPLDLERIRQIKSRLVAITGRVQKVRDVLEHLLDDEEDMAEMYLTEKLAQSMNESDTVEVDLPEGDEDDRNSHKTHHKSSTRSAMRNKFDVQELELLLDTYFVQINGTLTKLSTLRTNVDDTEDCINITQDDKQNKLLQMSVKLATGTLVMSAYIAVAGVFGMNISIELFKDEKAGPRNFLWTVIGGFLGSLFLCVGLFGLIGWCKSNRS